MKINTLLAGALALCLAVASAGTALAKNEGPSNNSSGAQAAAAARQAAAREAAQKQAEKEAREREQAARAAERQRVVSRVYDMDPFTYGQRFNPVTLRKLIAVRMQNRNKPRSPGKPPESPADHDRGHGNDDKDHGPHDDHDNGNHNGQARR